MRLDKYLALNYLNGNHLTIIRNANLFPLRADNHFCPLQLSRAVEKRALFLAMKLSARYCCN